MKNNTMNQTQAQAFALESAIRLALTLIAKGGAK